jgi:hypothetical protein
MLTCPLCGREIRRGDLRPDGFRCPRCKERLRLDVGRTRLALLGTVFLAFLIPYLAGARGNTLLEYGVFLWLPFFLGYAVLHGIFLAKLVKDTRNKENDFPHIIPPPGPPRGA